LLLFTWQDTVLPAAVYLGLVRPIPTNTSAPSLGVVGVTPAPAGLRPPPAPVAPAPTATAIFPL